MRDLPVEIADVIAQRQGIVVRTLFWVEAKNRVTGESETIGIWNGEDVQQFVINSDVRTYYGAGSFINFGELVQESGLTIRRLTANVSPLSPEMQTLLRTYEPKFAPVQVHLAFYDPENMTLIAPPFRVFKGWIDTMSINTPAINDVGSSVINMVSNSRILTRILPTKRSNENQKRRNATDTMFQYVAMTGTINTPWGTKDVDAKKTGIAGLFQKVEANMQAVKGGFGK